MTEVMCYMRRMTGKIPLLRSDRLVSAGIAHGFSLRSGGVSKPRFDRMNVGRGPLDDPAAVLENHRRLAFSVGYRASALYELTQVHGHHVALPAPEDDPVTFRASEGDALIGGDPGLAVAVKTADCVPLLLADPETGVVAAVHAGWRGVVAGVVSVAVSALLTTAVKDGVSSGTRLRAPRLVAAIMPHIRRCCFEVGQDVAEQLLAAAPGAEPEEVVCHPAPGARPRIALASLVTTQLLRAGLTTDRVDDVPGCTVCDPERFFSYRRDGAHAGRHMAVIVAGRG